MIYKLGELLVINFHIILKNNSSLGMNECTVYFRHA